MERSQYDLLEVLDHIEPAELDYQQWLNIGMALDLEGSRRFISVLFSVIPFFSPVFHFPTIDISSRCALKEYLIWIL